VTDSSNDSVGSNDSEHRLVESGLRSVSAFDARKELIHWGEAQAWVVRIWMFGSRMKETHRADSDIDIAIEPRWTPELRYCANFQAMVCAIREEFSTSISELRETVPFEVDLQFYGGPDETPNIHAYLAESSTVVYETRSNK
jgi:predicted nucleotidyltransferase